jgi:hypothetical protein
MTTDSAIVEVSKVCTPTDHIPDWFSGLVPVNLVAGCVQKNPVNPVTGFGPRPVFAIDGKRRGQDQY